MEGHKLNMTKYKRHIFATSSLISFSIGLVSVFSIIVFRANIMRYTLLGDLGPGYISLTALAINGYDPHVFYRIMHNLTIIWSLIPYFLLMTIGVVLTAKTSWKSQTIVLCHYIFAIIHIVFFTLFILSTFMPVGDIVSLIAEN
jgi:hypothetical protein